ncbi:MAG: glycoside hydrolase, partial [Armatimonadota bacterium]|nr:glycoside hydrolase [Armatimonadota bacterium]
REELEAIHLQPFRAAIAAGVGGMMIGHIAVPAVDASGTPASLSQPIVTGILRGEMNFRGLVFTDDLEMKALDQSDPGALAVRALQAGCDMLLFCHAPEKAQVARTAILDAVHDGTLTSQRVQNSIERVRWVKRKFGIVGE